jgi:hypothetical protein
MAPEGIQRQCGIAGEAGKASFGRQLNVRILDKCFDGDSAIADYLSADSPK